MNRNKICPTPFNTLIFNPNGDVGACRQLTNHHVVGNIFEQKLEDIWNGEKLRSWRREFLEGKIETCKECMEYRNCHRSGENNELFEATTYEEIQEAPILRMSPDFNGKCNLTCNMCDIWTLPNGLYDEHKLWPMFEEKVFPHLKVMEPLGGEPFVQPDTYRLIKIMNKVNPECKWTFTTNAHWKLNKSITQHLDMIKDLDIRVSLDGMSEATFKKIRDGSLELVLKTIDDLHKYSEERIKNDLKPVRISLAMTVQKYNWHEMHLFAEYGLQKKFFDFHFQETVGDEEYKGEDNLILKKMPEHEKKRICDYILEKMPKGKSMLKSKEVLFPILETLQNPEKNLFKKMFYQRSLWDL